MFSFLLVRLKPCLHLINLDLQYIQDSMCLSSLINIKFYDFPFHKSKCICFQNNTPKKCIVTLKE